MPSLLYSVQCQCFFGTGAESQVSLGCAVVFGMAVNALIGTLFVPYFWDFMERIGGRFGSTRVKV